MTRSTTLPSRPTDRLFADRDHLETARGYFDEVSTDSAPGPRREPSAEDIDALFARIVADFHGPCAPERRPWPALEEWPAAEDRPAIEDRPADEPGLSGPSQPPHRRRRTDWLPEDAPADQAEEPSLLDGLDRFGADLPDEDEEGYTPPPPPPFPRLSQAAVLSTLAIVVGMVLFLRPALVPVAQNTVMLGGFAAVVAGFLGLVWRLRSGEDDYDDPDDGARV